MGGRWDCGSKTDGHGDGAETWWRHREDQELIMPSVVDFRDKIDRQQDMSQRVHGQLAKCQDPARVHV